MTTTHVHMMREAALTDDQRADLLRQASDPATPGPVLLQLLGQPLHFLKPVVVGNPALPVDVIARLLRAPLTDGNAPVLFAIWFNPSVPLAMLSLPAREYEEHARDVLGHFSRRRLLVARLLRGVWRWSLPRLVEWWAGESFEVSQMIAPEPKDVEAVRLARRLADLFSLPWPEP